MAPTMEPNPVTGVKEPYFPEKTRLSRMITGSMVIIMMVRRPVKRGLSYSSVWKVARQEGLVVEFPRVLPVSVWLLIRHSEDLI